jgi:hypothetical protein
MRQNAHDLLHPRAPFVMLATLARSAVFDDRQELGEEPRDRRWRLIEGPVLRRAVCNRGGQWWLRAYSITSSARASSEGGKVRPSALAVLRLRANSTFVTRCTGRSAGLSPLRIRPV